MTSIFLIRHGRTTWNEQSRVQGQADIPLDDTGRQQAAARGEAFRTAKIFPAAIYTSDLQRSIETARIIADTLSAGEPILDDRLRERSWGEAEGLNSSLLRARYGEDLRHAAIPGAEPIAAVVSRMHEALTSYVKQHRGETIFVVSHAGAISNWLLEHFQLETRPRIKNTDAVTVKFDWRNNSWRLENLKV